MEQTGGDLHDRLAVVRPMAEKHIRKVAIFLTQPKRFTGVELLTVADRSETISRWEAAAGGNCCDGAPGRVLVGSRAEERGVQCWLTVGMST
jgi:hypothetical protein